MAENNRCFKIGSGKQIEELVERGRLLHSQAVGRLLIFLIRSLLRLPGGSALTGEEEKFHKMKYSS